MTRTARLLRRIADRIDREHAPKRISRSFTFERGEGIRFRDDGKGCPLWYLSDSDYDRAHAESDTAAARQAQIEQMQALFGAISVGMEEAARNLSANMRAIGEAMRR